MQYIEDYKTQFLDYLTHFNLPEAPSGLYKPIRYILELGGKRMRPVLTLLVADAFGASVKEALPAALCVEVFHNFSLVHDDIMDNSPTRRGQPTVHEKWDVNTGILSGDAMLILAYDILDNYPPELFKVVTKLLSKTALQVCEGQQYDVDFETRNDVTINEYLKMIAYKTAVLVGCAMQMGAVVAKASPEDQKNIYDFGLHLGLAFQLQDDYLDAFGNPETFGKQVGGDIIENKKTYLYLKALELLNEEESRQLQQLFSVQLANNTDKIKTVKALFVSSGSANAAKALIKEYTHKAFLVLENLSIPNDKKEALKQFGQYLMTRNV